MIVCFTAGTGYLLLTNVSMWSTAVTSPIFPCILMMVIAYVIAALFMSIFSFASDTILQSFLTDEEISQKNDGREAQHRPKSLDKFIESGKAKGCC